MRNCSPMFGSIVGSSMFIEVCRCAQRFRGLRRPSGFSLTDSVGISFDYGSASPCKARSTSIPRTSYTVLLQSGNSQPTAWFAPDASASSVFVPFFSAALSEGGAGRFDLEAYGTGSMKSFSFITKPGGVPPAWWAHDFVANWMDLSYQNMSETYVYPAVQRIQRRVIEEAASAIKELVFTQLQRQLKSQSVM